MKELVTEMFCNYGEYFIFTLHTLWGDKMGKSTEARGDVMIEIQL